MYPNCIKKLVECLRDLPGIGEKSALRLAFSIINYDKDKLDEFSQALLDIKNNIKRCSVCNNITDKDVCDICSNKDRDSGTIFVVEKPKDVILFEKIGNYTGKYHVLNGLISPLDGIGPNDINIKSLVDRVNSDNVKEVIIVLKPSIEGETTMQYIKKVLDGSNVKVSRIATGIPMGTDIEYIDTMTLETAFMERKDIA